MVSWTGLVSSINYCPVKVEWCNVADMERLAWQVWEIADYTPSAPKAELDTVSEVTELVD